MSMNDGFQTDPREAQILLAAVQQNFLYPLTVGLWLDSVCLGLVLVLLAHYTLTAYKRDNVRVRGLVLYLMAVACVATGLMVLQVFVYVVKGFGSYSAFRWITYYRLFPALNAISRVPASCFFAIRAWRLHDKKIWVPALLVPTLLACLIGGIIATTLIDPTPGNLETSSRLLMITPACEVVTDIIITAALYSGLRKRKTGWARTDELLKRVMAITIETQLPPLVVAIAFLITVITVDRGLTSAYFVFYPKVHTICLLLVLVTRGNLASGGEQHSGVDVKGPLVHLDLNLPAQPMPGRNLEFEREDEHEQTHQPMSHHDSTVDLVDKTVRPLAGVYK